MDDLTPTTMSHKPVIGLMGGPGSGKSTAARLFADLGCAVIDADQLAHDAIQTAAVKRELRAWWGDAVFDSSGAVDRNAVGRIVFGDKQALRRLEGLIHPIVNDARRRERQHAMADSAVVAIVEDCPLLLESGIDKQCDTLVFLDCPFPIRLARLSASRGWDEAELKKREQSQLPLDTKRRSADYVISTDADLDTVRQQAAEVLQQISH